MEDDMKRFGFGFMRLPRRGSGIDYERTNEMVDRFIEAGGNFFDTGYDYLGGKSEIAIRESVVKRYPREKILISDKMPVYTMSGSDDPVEIFNNRWKDVVLTILTIIWYMTLKIDIMKDYARIWIFSIFCQNTKRKGK